MRILRHAVPSRLVLWSGHVLVLLLLAWIVSGAPSLGIASALLGGAYSAVSILAPHRMPGLTLEGLPRVPEKVAVWSSRLLGVAGIPLWVAAWRNHVPHLPPGLLMPVGIGIAVAVAAQLLLPETRGQSARASTDPVEGP